MECPPRQIPVVAVVNRCCGRRNNQFLPPLFHQSFSLPANIIYFITKKSSIFFPKVYEKLQKSCKYFYFKNPAFISDSLECNENGWRNIDHDTLEPNNYNLNFFTSKITKKSAFKQQKMKSRKRKRSPPSFSIYSNPPKIQNFSLPENLVYYLSKNPQFPEIYKKLIRTCKYFYLKSSILLFSDSVAGYSDGTWDPQKINGARFSGKIKNLTKKVWIQGPLKIYNRNDKFMASILASKIYRCDITHLLLYEQNLTFNEFKIFVSNGKMKILDFIETVIKDENGNVTPLENLIKEIPSVQQFCFNIADGDDGRRSITSKTAENLLKIPHFQNLKVFHVFNVPENFDFETFFNNLKKPSKMDIFLDFDNHISMDYQKSLHKLVEDIISTCKLSPTHQPPLIEFPGMTIEEFNELKKLCEEYKIRSNN